jgi:hypothetical protein
MNLIKTKENRIEIPLSKLKLTLLFFLGVAFVISGCFFIISPSTFTDNGVRHTPKIKILIIGYATVIFFGAGVIISIIRFFDNKPGLLIDNLGITINPGSWSNTFIEWNKIEKFGVTSISRTKLILVHLHDPEGFIDTFSNSFKRKIALFSLKSYGTPISISAGTLQIKTDELFTLLTDKLNGQK